MPRSHPPTLLTLATRAIRDARLVARGERVLAAVSGGPDSMALLHVLARLQDKLGFTVVAHGVDHGLRPAAAEELDRAEAFAATLDVPFGRTVVHVAPGSNLQARAREARYDALDAAAIACGAAAIATAHHMEDRAETLLLRLLRGAGPAGLAVLPPRAAPTGPGRPARIRPLLRATRAAIDAHIARHAVPFSRDPSNADPRFARARVRHELLPLLRDLSPAIVEHLCALADQLEPLRAAAGVKTPFALSSALPRPPGRAARTALDEIVASRSQSRAVFLPGGLVATYDRAQGSIVIGGGNDTKRRRPSRRPADPGDM